MSSDPKKALRARMRAARIAFAIDSPSAIVVSDEFRTRLKPGLVVTSYIPMPGEADPGPLAGVGAGAGCTLALPHVTTMDQPMRFLSWRDEITLESGPLGLRQPPADMAELTPDIILTPLLAFDSTLNRLGQGAGYYDRVFARYPNAWRVGVAWSIQQVDEVPHAPWDVPLHAIATEREWITR